MAGNALKTFSCPSCGAPVELRAQGRSLSVVCPSCLTILDPNSPQYDILSKFTGKANRIQPLIPLGSRGTLRGTVLECIGFMVRSDKTDSFSWDEYLLYNPMVGYRWLVVQNGHCNFVTPLKAPPIKSQAEIGVNNFTYNNQKYERYTDEPAIVQFVLGEFYWAVRIGETVRTVDFICPPHMLSFEITSSEIMASLGEYMPMDEVAAAFKLDNPPAPFGVAPNQVNDLKADSDAIILMSIPFWLGIAVIGGKYSYDNLLTFSLLLLGYVFFYFKRMNGFENQRWENSDYASYHITASSDDSDD